MPFDWRSLRAATAAKFFASFFLGARASPITPPSYRAVSNQTGNVGFFPGATFTSDHSTWSKSFWFISFSFNSAKVPVGAATGEVASQVAGDLTTEVSLLSNPQLLGMQLLQWPLQQGPWPS